MANYNNNPPYPPYAQQPPPVQTQNLNQNNQQRPYSPPSYQQSPTAMSPTMGSGIPPAKRQRLSPNPPSPAPYQSPFGTAAYPHSPYATSPQSSGYLSAPMSPATRTQPPPFHQPQPYQQPNHVPQPPAPQSSMPPPKVPYSKATDNAELEKANARDLDVNNISDVLTGSGIDLRAEEDNLLQSYRSATSQTTSPHASFDWSQQSNSGAFQGSGPLNVSKTEEQLKHELTLKHERAARILNEKCQQPLTDPFLAANILRHRIAKRAYENGIQVNVDGLFDKIPDKTPRDVTRTTLDGENGEQIVGLEAASLLNTNAPLVEVISLLALATEDRIRTLVEDSFALSEARRNTSHGVIPPQLLDLAVIENDAKQHQAPVTNVLKTPWEAQEGSVNPTVAMKQPLNSSRLPTPPIEAAPVPQPTFRNANIVAQVLSKRAADDERWEQERLKKRQKRQQGDAATPASSTPAPIPIPEPLTKKAQAAAKKHSQSEDAMFGKANETASLALGGKKKKYAWMTGGGGLSSGASTPRPAATGATGSGANTPAATQVEKGPRGKKRTFGSAIEEGDIGAKVQIRDLIHALDNDGRERKTLAWILARQRNTDKDATQQELRTSVR